MTQEAVLISIVIPVLDEETAVSAFLEKVADVMGKTGYDYELIFVDDGSSDDTVRILDSCRKTHTQIKIIELSRNYGKEAALSAGLAFSQGGAVIPMDVDLQDPPELIPDMIQAWNAGAKVVLAVRKDRQSDHWLKRFSARYFYKFMSRATKIDIPANCGDFRLMDRAVVNVVLSFPERNRFMKGIMASAGFRPVYIEYVRVTRKSGKTKFNFWRLWNFALDGITGFSTFPLRIWSYMGVLVAFLSFVYASWIIAKTLILGVDTPGYATMLTVILFLGGIQLIGIGVLGEYMGRIFEETKHRPLYVIQKFHGFDATDAAVKNYNSQGLNLNKMMQPK
jgi:glycosyltransferase involved in cell wall biosynthesis